MGLTQEGSGVAADVIKNLDIDPKNLRQEVERVLSHGTTMVPMGKIPFTPAVKTVFELALEEASSYFGHDYIGTEHLLLGLIREQEGIAAQVFQNNKVRLEDVREEVLELLCAEVTPGEEVPRLLEADDAAAPFSDVAKLIHDLGERVRKLEEDRRKSVRRAVTLLAVLAALAVVGTLAALGLLGKWLG